MENKEKNIPIPALKDEDLDAVSGGLDQPEEDAPLPDPDDPFLDGPDSRPKPPKPGERPNFF